MCVCERCDEREIKDKRKRIEDKKENVLYIFLFNLKELVPVEVVYKCLVCRCYSNHTE